VEQFKCLGKALTNQNSIHEEINVLLLLLTAIGLSPGDSSPTLVQTKIKIRKTTITFFST
jgi:hypothetical protein